MNKVANLSGPQRRDLFQETAHLRGMNPAIIEKDFWVCWALKQLFADPELGGHLVFKGGTSLSKVFGLIERFSEDIDFVLDWRLLGYGEGQEDPYQAFTSRSQQDRFNKVVNEKAGAFIAGPLLSSIQKILSIGPDVKVGVDTADPHSLDVQYSAAFSQDYIRPAVRLEIGPLASWVPSDRHNIRPYAYDAFPKIFEKPDCPVIAISAERTFWEKATILHQEAHRSGFTPPRYSRHYYDIYRLAESPIRQSALDDLELLRQVVSFKQRFYPCGWARYENATPGKFRLAPNKEQLPALRRDYSDMHLMIFGTTPDFDVVIETIKLLEDQINTLQDL